ncbi:MAG: hypothetical protein H8Z69_03850 [Nanohaloarchaea archaeon]|nr:hypothetical protein [Candidatus Nanohaloarchaea archaeon]
MLGGKMENNGKNKAARALLDIKTSVAAKTEGHVDRLQTAIAPDTEDRSIDYKIEDREDLTVYRGPKSVTVMEALDADHYSSGEQFDTDLKPISEDDIEIIEQETYQEHKKLDPEEVLEAEEKIYTQKASRDDDKLLEPDAKYPHDDKLVWDVSSDVSNSVTGIYNSIDEAELELEFTKDITDVELEKVQILAENIHNQDDTSTSLQDTVDYSKFKSEDTYDRLPEDIETGIELDTDYSDRFEL